MSTEAGAPIIVTALFAAADQAMLDRLREAHFPPERNHLAAHLTLFYHLPPSIEGELRRRLDAATRGEHAPTAELAGVMNLGGGTALRVVSPGLEAIRADLAEAFAGLLVPQDRAGWRPHVTIQNKVVAATARALQEELARAFRPSPVAISGLAAWWYRGGPWEPLSRHSFR